jgi:outer membrane protein assembly factor BamB
LARAAHDQKERPVRLTRQNQMTGMPTRRMLMLGLGATALTGLAACNRQRPLEGERLDIRAPFGGGGADANQARPISLPAQSANPGWTHRQGLNGARPTHPALSANPQRIWSAAIGQGDARRQRLATDPVVQGGVIYTLDAQARVQATSAAGQPIWATDLTPEGQRSPNASGGGLAIEGGRLYVTSAFAFIAALDAATGREIWRHRFDAPVTGAPAVQGDRVFVAANDSTMWSMDAGTGRIDWSIAGAESITTVARGSAPAVTGDLVILPTKAGELTAVRRANGGIAWSSVVTGRRTGAAYATISAITGDPVVDGNRIYTANHQGRLVALDRATGQTVWAAREAAFSPVWPVGGSVFLVTDENRLLRLNAADGAPVWSVELPLYQPTRRERNRLAIFAQHGPVLAGGRLWVGSSDGALRGFDPVSGAQTVEIAVPGGAASGPIVAGQTLYLLGRTGQLHAYR